MVELLSVQKEAHRRANLRPGFAYFMEQGLCKTGTVLTEFHQLRERRLADGMAVLCPNTIKENWVEELKEVYQLPYTPGVWPKVDPRKKGEDPDVFVMNYEALLGQGQAAMEHFVNTRRVMLSADESTRIKSHSAQTTKKVLLLTKYTPYSRVLSGTPMVQNVMDLWSQLRAIGELSGVNPYAFRNHYAVMGGYMGKEIVGYKNETEMQRLLDSCSFRALKKDWLHDLPEKMPPVIHDVIMTPEQKTVYDEMRQDFYTLVKKHEISASQVITQMERLAQISRGFLYDENHKVIELVPPEQNPAIKETLNIISQCTGKVIIMTLHQYMTDTMRQMLPNAAYIISEERMKDTTVEHQKKRFNQDPQCRAIIVQLSVGAYGHTLLGGPGVDRCATTIFLENSYSLEKRLQGEDRNHRKGQDRGVSYYDISTSPMDRRILKALHRKQNMVAAIIDAVKNVT